MRNKTLWLTHHDLDDISHHIFHFYCSLVTFFATIGQRTRDCKAFIMQPDNNREDVVSYTEKKHNNWPDEIKRNEELKGKEIDLSEWKVSSNYHLADIHILHRTRVTLQLWGKKNEFRLDLSLFTAFFSYLLTLSEWLSGSFGRKESLAPTGSNALR